MNVSSLLAIALLVMIAVVAALSVVLLRLTGDMKKIDFCIGIFGDIIIFQILILIFKSFIFVLMIKCGDTCVIGSVLKCFLTTIPFLFSLEE